MLDALHTDLLRAALRELTPAYVGWSLDLGCGAGAKTGWIDDFRVQERNARALMGIDTDRRALAAARVAHPTGIWLCGDAHALPLATASIDVIWCVAVLGLLADQTAALREARRVLRPGGTLVLAQATQRWVRLRATPAPLPPAPAAHPPADDLGHESAAALYEAGFNAIQLRAYLLDPPGLTAAAAQAPLLATGPLEPFSEPEPLPVLITAAGVKM